jgi:SEL1 protein
MNGPPVDKEYEEDGNQEILDGPLAEGTRLLQQAASRNNTDAIYLLAQMNFYGNFTHPRNFHKAFERYQELAVLNGNATAYHMLGFMYSTGIGNAVERDQGKAQLYHTFAAKAGDIRSEMTLAFRFHSGIATARNCNKSVEYYKRVADKVIDAHRSGSPGGTTFPSELYYLSEEDGGVYGEGASVSSAGMNARRGSPNSDAHAALDDVLEYLDLMSRKGDFKATFSLGRLHYDGQKGPKGLKRNMRKAKQYFIIVARQRWKDGQIIESDKPGIERIAAKAAGYLGHMFLRGEGVEQSFQKAREWFDHGNISGNAGCQYGLGLMYLNGLGVPRDPLRAFEYFNAASKQEFAPAMIALGKMYLDQGEEAHAARYFESASRQGQIEAHYYIAELFNKGITRERSCSMATAYYKSVVEKAEIVHSSILEAIQAYETGDYDTALIDFMMAAEQGYEQAQANVAYLLDTQKSSVPIPYLSPFKQPRSPLLQNPPLALIYWTRSAKQGNIDSMVKMGDYYLNGIGAEADVEKAASCYTTASELRQSAQALYNLGWMHENGVGLIQDFHLAKRYYDQALETNVEAYLPVSLSLFKLRLRSAWNTFTHGKINSIRSEPGKLTLYFKSYVRLICKQSKRRTGL